MIGIQYFVFKTVGRRLFIPIIRNFLNKLSLKGCSRLLKETVVEGDNIGAASPVGVECKYTGSKNVKIFLYLCGKQGPV
jgi:hypothetical protein